MRRPAAAGRVTGTPETPAMYGTNPHGMGTVAGVALNPSTSLPLPYDPTGKANGQTIILGQGRSEQNTDGTYHAHTTIIALLGAELLGVDAPQGTSHTGPLNAIQMGILDALCKSTSQAVCLTVLAADTIAGASGGSTHFAVLDASIGGPNGLSTGVADSNSSINTTSTCQTASGNSQVANVMLNGGQVAQVAKSSESSTACQGQTPTQTASSSVIGLGGTGVPIPAPGCANGTPNTVGGLPPLLPIICNADSTGIQLPVPSGVREALTVLALETSNSSLLKTVTAASESHAVAPSKCTDSDKDCGVGEKCVNGVDPDGDGDCTGNKCTDADHDCGIGPNGQPETCINHKDPDGDGDCSGNKTTGPTTPPSGSQKCTDSDHDCGKGPPGTGTCTNDTTDGDGDCVLPGGGSETGAPSGFVNEQTPVSTAASSLPFTGENVLEVILVGLVLVGGGIGLAMRSGRS
jgi:hypothetical protein